MDTIIFATLTDTNVFNFFLSKLKKKKVLHTLCHNNKDNIIKVKKKKKKKYLKLWNLKPSEEKMYFFFFKRSQYKVERRLSGRISFLLFPTSCIECGYDAWKHIILCFFLRGIAALGLPWWPRGKESTCQYWRHRFDPWVRKIPWRRK